MTDLDKLASTSPYAFGIVVEAKVRALVAMVKTYQPDVTLDQFRDTVNRWIKDEWEKKAVKT